jgi:hypothetical protein
MSSRAAKGAPRGPGEVPRGPGAYATDAAVVTVEAVPAAGPDAGGTGGFGVRAGLGPVQVGQSLPVRVVLASAGLPGRGYAYSQVQPCEDGFVGTVDVPAGGSGAVVSVRDRWAARGGQVTVTRSARVVGEGPGAFMTALSMWRSDAGDWTGATPYAPGAVYGDCGPLPECSIAGPGAPGEGLREAFAREDRLAVPMFALRFADGAWLSVMHVDAQASTIMADQGLVAGGETLVDARLGYASLGFATEAGRLSLGALYPGTEGPTTYSTGRAPLKQYRRWRRRFHPLSDGQVQSYSLAFCAGRAPSAPEFFRQSWRMAWATWAPTVETVGSDDVVTSCTRVLADQVVRRGDRAGVPLEVDSRSGQARPGSPAIMGFVGANTDAGYVLVRMRERLGGADGRHLAELGAAVLDSFTRVALAPPRAEGFDLRSGRPRTYRKVGAVPAVYARSIADGCSGALKAWEYEKDRGRSHDNWLGWAVSGADWLVGAQAADGSLPRAWQAGTGRVIDASTNASHVPTWFLARLGSTTGEARYLAAAEKAADFAWAHGGSQGCFAGATLDNPDVVDKEAAVYALEGFLGLYAATGERRWVERAAVAASMAETWTYIWDIPMPLDGGPDDVHWGRGVSTVGQQLIATGVSMCDGFLAVNAAAFAHLYALSGDEHFLDVARLVTHGTKAMLSLPGRQRGPLGPGWQQEHWSLAIPRGRGLTRDWLPWVSVAHVEGVLRLEDLPGGLGALVLAPAGRP